MVMIIHLTSALYCGLYMYMAAERIPGASLLWGPHDIIIFKLDPSQSPN